MLCNGPCEHPRFDPTGDATEPRAWSYMELSWATKHGAYVLSGRTHLLETFLSTSYCLRPMHGKQGYG
jgi:hypothetical protein